MKISGNSFCIYTPYVGKVAGTNINHHGLAEYDNGTAHVYNEVNGSRIILNVPSNTKVVFKNLTINGYYNFITSSANLTLVFENCTFTGAWVGHTNNISDLKFLNCVFTLDSADQVNVKNTNNLWLQVVAGSSLTIDGCLVEGNRPIKVDGDGTVTITNTAFKLSPSAYDTNANRLDRLTAVRFGSDTADAVVPVLNISNNIMIGGYAFYQTNNTPYSNDNFDDAGNNNIKPDGALWRAEY